MSVPNPSWRQPYISKSPPVIRNSGKPPSESENSNHAAAVSYESAIHAHRQNIFAAHGQNDPFSAD